MILYLLILILIIALVYVYTKVQKLEKTSPKVQELPDGSYSIIYKDLEIYNAKPASK